MSTDHRAMILNTAISAPCGVREIIEKLKLRSSDVISLIEKMEEERLIDLQYARKHRQGRPKKIITCTSLGIDYLQTYKRLKTKPLRARKEDLERAVKDAQYTKRLIANGHSAYELFMELNTIASNIKITSKTTQPT